MDDDRAHRTLYVGNLETDVTEDILYELFLQAGPLVSVKRMADKPFAFVEFKHDVSVPYAKDIMEGTHLFKRLLRLQFRSGSVHQRQSQPQQNFQRSNSYPNPHDQSSSSHHQQNMNASQFQGQDSRQVTYMQQQGNYRDHNREFDRNQQNNDFRRSPQYHRTQSYNEQELGSKGHSSYDGGRSRHHDRGNSRGHMQNEPQEIIQKQMRRSAETGMRHSPGNRGQYQRSGGHPYWK